MCRRFSGNIKTLKEVPEAKGINVRDELLKFHDTWYSANIMALAVLGKGNSWFVSSVQDLNI